MCFFPRYLNFKKTNQNMPDYFKCGCCPECLSSRASEWSLRSSMEYQSHVNSCMITLTYDHFKFDSTGAIVGELPVDASRHVLVEDVQKFIKRLRKNAGSRHFRYSLEKNFKYLCAAEYGSRTHRAHYHLLLFGVKFYDAFPYKKSKRGNQIYRSDSLERLWQHGICTIDSTRIGSAVARYCTKYMMKNYGADDTFMLFSHGIGVEKMLEKFNARSYFVEGHEHPIPRVVWQKYIERKLSFASSFFTTKYKRFDHITKEYYDFKALRDNYRFFRDNLPEYQSYLAYWRYKSEVFESAQRPLIERVDALPDSKFHNYKIAVYRWYGSVYGEKKGSDLVPPRSSEIRVRAYYEKQRDKFLRCPRRYLPLPPRPLTAIDTKKDIDDVNPFDVSFLFRKKDKKYLLFFHKSLDR